MTGAKSPFARIAEVTEEETFQVLTFLECAVKFDYANIIIPLPRGRGGGGKGYQGNLQSFKKYLKMTVIYLISTKPSVLFRCAAHPLPKDGGSCPIPTYHVT